MSETLLNIIGIHSAYKGEVETGEQKLQKMIEGFERQGSINIRPHERIMFITDYVYPSVQDRDKITLNSETIITKGLQLMISSPIFEEEDRRLLLLVHNPSNHLCTIDKGEQLAKLT